LAWLASGWAGSKLISACHVPKLPWKGVPV
jgi:hypothetical protein